MQLLEVILYNASGATRSVFFRPGAFNVVTGVSGTGKSALLHVVEFCLGRDNSTVPAGVIYDAVDWYGLRVQLGTGQAFIGRPRPAPGKSSTSLAMLEIAQSLSAPAYTDLVVNSNTAGVRERLSRSLGVEENRHLPPPGSLRHPLEAGLGQAALLCFQGQGEIANQNLLFHRQGEDGIAQALKDSLPYFLGAVPADNALRRLELLQARRDLRRVETDLQNAQRQSEAVDTQVQALLDEAYSNGLVESRIAVGREAALSVLLDAVKRPSTPTGSNDDFEQTVRRRELEARRGPLRSELREVADQRALLLDQGKVEDGYSDTVASQVARLRPLEIVPFGAAGMPDADCPMCGSLLDEADPGVDEMRVALGRLREDLDGVLAAQPRREAALRELDQRADRALTELRAIEAGLAEVRAGDQYALAATSRAEELAYRKGRLAALLDRVRPGSGTRDKEQAVRAARQMVADLEEVLDPELERSEVVARLNAVGEDMGRWARDRLRLEHSDQPVRLDIGRLTVVVDSETGTIPLARIGSAENWVGYHLVAHLALHRYFVRRGRPVPQFLMLDQPTQAYYPSEREQETGEFESAEDRLAVQRLFELMRDVVEELSPDLQIIVCDHANLDEEWFQDAVGENNWRGGRALIPSEWISESPQSSSVAVD